MKNILLILIVLCLAVNAYAGADLSVYKDKVEKCEVVFKKEAENAVTMYDQKKSAYNAAHCYNNIADDIADKYYSKNKDKVKENFKKFADSAFISYNDFYTLRDYCTPTCGSMSELFGISYSADMLKQMTLSLIKSIEDFND